MCFIIVHDLVYAGVQVLLAMVLLWCCVVSCAVCFCLAHLDGMMVLWKLWTFCIVPCYDQLQISSCTHSKTSKPWTLIFVALAVLFQSTFVGNVSNVGFRLLTLLYWLVLGKSVL